MAEERSDSLISPASVANLPPLKVSKFKAEVIDLKDLTYDIKEVTLKLIEPDRIQFRPGQFMSLQIPTYELSAKPVTRSYSIASPLSSQGLVQFEIRYVPNGLATTFIHKYLKTGDIIEMTGPYGLFFLRQSDSEIIFIAGGSGMAPIRSILYQMKEEGIKRKARYFFGARAVRDLFLTGEMEEFERSLYDFKFIPALSDPLPDDNWKGETGLIPDVVSRYYPAFGNMEAYLCGSPAMIDACIKMLKSKGLQDNQIFYDKFV